MAYSCRLIPILGLFGLTAQSQEFHNDQCQTDKIDMLQLGTKVTNYIEKLEPFRSTIDDYADMALVIRAYSGDAPGLHELLGNLQMFVPRHITRVVVLDDENPQDHELGTALIATWNISVKYEALPTSFDLQVTERFCKQAPKYCRVGYTRQQWSSFYLDRYTDAALIGQIDTDARLFSFLAPFSIATDEGGKIIVRASPHESPEYGGDSWFLNSSEIDYNPMRANNFPMFFWRKTFEQFRAHVAAIHGVSQFDEAFSRLQLRGDGFSWQNLLYRYALHYHADMYTLCDPYSPTKACLTIGYNGDCQPTRQIAAGCCRTFNELACDPSLKKDTQHLLQQGETFVYNKKSAYYSRQDLVHAHYATVNKYLQEQLDMSEARNMQDRCDLFVNPS